MNPTTSSAEQTITLQREVPFGLIEFEERPPDPKTGKQYRAYHVTINGQRKRFASVTTILGVLDKPALVKWQVGLAASTTLELARAGVLDGVEVDEALAVVNAHDDGASARANEAAERGKVVHTVLERYAISGDAPNLSDFDPAHRGYVRGLAKWLLDDDPQPEAIEQLVAHPQHRYAGRFDLRARVRGVGSCLIDLKTNREGRIYREAHLQGLAYALADEQCGAQLADDILLIGVSEDGRYERVHCAAKPADWHAIVHVRNRMTSLDIALRQARELEAA